MLRSTSTSCAPLLALILLAPACKSDEDPGMGDEGSTSAEPGSTSTGPSTSAASMTSTSAASTSTTDDTVDPDSSSSGNVIPPSGECILWADECGEGQKCMPYSIEDDRIPDNVQCCDAVDSPASPGDPCTAMGYNGSCLDDCEPGSMCVLDDEKSLGGHCRTFCEPGGNDCEFDETCKSFFELLPGVPTTPLCMERCDPLLQDCTPDDWHCIPDTPTESGQSGFLCSPPPPSIPKGLFDPCALANDCEQGLVCVTDDRVPGCNFSACCTAYCSLSEGDEACQALNADLECVDWMSPDPDWFDVGACALPPQ